MEYLLQGTVTAFLIIVFFGILKLFGVSYFSEKGKNLATKQDIGEITKEIESIKKGFEKEVRIAGANLDLMRSNTEKRMAAEVQALTFFFEKYYLYIESISDSSYLLTLDFSEEKVNTLEKCVEDGYGKIKVAFAAIQLYVGDFEIIKSALKLQQSALMYHEKNYGLVSDLRRIASKKENVPLNDEGAEKRNNLLNYQWVEKVRIHFEEIQNLYSQNFDTTNDFCKLFRKYINRYTDIDLPTKDNT